MEHMKLPSELQDHVSEHKELCSLCRSLEYDIRDIRETPRNFTATLGAIKETLGAIKETLGTTRERPGATRKTFGATQKRFGAVKEALGAIRRANGNWHGSYGVR